jgi:hypothetical protein
MTTGAKIAIGCAVAVVLAGIVAMVAIGGAAWWLKGKVTEVAGDIGAKAEDIEVYEKKANANPFTEPADGVVQEPRFLKFMEARKAIYAVYEQHRAQFEGLKDKKEADLSDLTKVAGLVADIRLAQAKALAAAGMSEDEYRFIQAAVYQSMWAAATVKDSGQQPSELLADAMKQVGDATRESLDKAGAQGLPSPSEYPPPTSSSSTSTRRTSRSTRCPGSLSSASEPAVRHPFATSRQCACLAPAGDIYSPPSDTSFLSAHT